MSDITTSTTTSSSSMDFSGRLADAELQLIGAGFTSRLWVPEFGWESLTEAEEMTPQQPQLLAAIQLFNQLYISSDPRVWAHLAAEMQAGKTGVITTFIRLVLANAFKLHMRPDRIFVLTGMNDDAWKKQTRSRMPLRIRENVHHSKGLAKVGKAFERLREGSTSSSLSNVIVVLDESHIAAGQNNQPYKQIWTTLQNLCPLDDWQAMNIRVITISATDPAKVIAIKAATSLPAAVVRLQTTAKYQSVETMNAQGRIRYTDTFGDLHAEDHKAIKEIKRSLENDFTSMSLYHILRPRPGKHAEVERLLSLYFPEASIRPWDAASKSTRSNATDDSTSGADMKDINEILCDAPPVTTFILLKNMFYAAKTLDDSNVGILYDRVGSKDDTNLQSLLGRACGYGKSDVTIVYTSRQTVDNYLNCWREACSNPATPRLVNIPASRIHAKMTGVHASVVTSASSSLLSVAPSIRTPLGRPSSDVVGAGGGSVKKKTANEDNFISEWREFATLAAAIAFSPKSHNPHKDESGFYETSTSNGPVVLRYDAVLAMQGGKKTANMDWNKMKSIAEGGKPAHRLYVGYKNINDVNSAVFVVHRLTRIA